MAKNDWTPPMKMTIEEDGARIAIPIEIQGEFARAWAKNVFCKQRTKPNWVQFKQQFSRYVPGLSIPEGWSIAKTFAKLCKAWLTRSLGLAAGEWLS